MMERYDNEAYLIADENAATFGEVKRWNLERYYSTLQQIVAKQKRRKRNKNK